jgi:hypothetical protein
MTLTDLTNLCWKLRHDAPLGAWSDGEQAAETIERLAADRITLANLLDGVLADDHAATVAAARWLTDNAHPERNDT